MHTLRKVVFVSLLLMLLPLAGSAFAQDRDNSTLPTLTCPAGYTQAAAFPTINPYDTPLIWGVNNSDSFNINLPSSLEGLLVLWSGLGHPEFNCGSGGTHPFCSLPEQTNERYYVNFDGVDQYLSTDSGEHLWIQEPNLDLGVISGGVNHTITFRHWQQGLPTDSSVFYSAILCTRPLPPSDQCTFTQGYWKNHPNAWPVNSLMLGSVNYNQTQLLAILNQPVRGNGLVSLAHQLIAVKLNIANGADPSAVNSAVAAADALIGGQSVPPVGTGYLAPNATSSLNSALDGYNNGLTGPGHCG